MPEPTGQKARPDAQRPDAESTLRDVLEHAEAQLRNVQKRRKKQAIVIYGGMEVWTALAASRVLRRMGKVRDLEVILESSGGDLDFAIKLYKMLRAHCEDLTVVVPFWAKSAGSMVAISADRVLLTPYGELGPIDPQVIDPMTDAEIPAHSIGRAIDFIEQETNDELVKMALATKLSPLLIGAYMDVVSATQQEVREACTRLHLSNPDAAVDALTAKYLSHGYPVTAETLKEHGFPIRMLEFSESEPFMQLHDHYIPLMRLHEHDDEGSCVLPVVVQTQDYHVAIWRGEIVSEKPLQHPAVKGSALRGPRRR